MKKFFGVLAVLAVTAMISSSVFAATETKATFTASMSFNARTTAFSAELVNSSGQSIQGTALSWNNVPASDWTMEQPGDQWKQADQIIKLSKTIDVGNAYVVMYQDNKNAAAGSDYVAVSSRTNIVKVNGQDVQKGVYNGLVRKSEDHQGGGNDIYVDNVLTTANYLPMAYYTSKNIAQGLDFSKVTSDSDGYGYRFLVDKSDEGVVSGVSEAASGKTPKQISANGNTPKTYYTIANSKGFVIDVDADSEIDNTVLESDTAYVAVAANFHAIRYGSSYGTDKILFELVTE